MKNNKTLASLCLYAALTFGFPVVSQATHQDAKWNPKTWVKKDKEALPTGFEAEKGEPVGGKAGEEIKTFMLNQAQKMQKIKGSLVSTLRNGEVLKVSIPSASLFLPDETYLLPNPDPELGPVLTLMREGLTRLLVTGHTADNGSESYLENISRERAQAVLDWYKKQGIPEKSMSLYAFGSKQPLFDNDSMENRSKNRRITLYLVPNDDMVKKAKRKRLNK